MIKTKDYRDEVEALLIKSFSPVGYELTKAVEIDTIPENSKYEV